MTGAFRPAFPSLKHCIESIDREYARLGHRQGWRFLAGPRRTFMAGIQFAFITLNPGGAHEDPEHPRSSSEKGSAYWIESWKGYPTGTAPLQLQVQELAARIVHVVGATESPRDFFETRVLMAHFIPFRSPSLGRLHRRRESVAFARRFWSDIFAAWMPRTILTMDRETFKDLTRIISDHPGELVAHRRFPTGWGGYTAEASRFLISEYDRTVTLARLPHLSRFRLMSKEACRQPVQDFLRHVYAPDLQSRPVQSPPSVASPKARHRDAHGAGHGPRVADASTPPGIDSDSHRLVGTPRLAGIDGADRYAEWGGVS